MKFSLAIVALLGATSAIKIRADPAPAPSADAVAEKAAGAPAANVVDPANPGKAVVAEALKTEEAKSDEAAAAASSRRCILSSRFSAGLSEVDAFPG